MRVVLCAMFLVLGASWAQADEPSQASVAAVRSTDPAQPVDCTGCGKAKGHALPDKVGPRRQRRVEERALRAPLDAFNPPIEGVSGWIEGLPVCVDAVDNVLHLADHTAVIGLDTDRAVTVGVSSDG